MELDEMSEKSDKMCDALLRLAKEYTKEGMHKQARFVRQMHDEIEVEMGARLYDLVKNARGRATLKSLIGTRIVGAHLTIALSGATYVRLTLQDDYSPDPLIVDVTPDELFNEDGNRLHNDLEFKA